MNFNFAAAQGNQRYNKNDSDSKNIQKQIWCVATDQGYCKN